jgi:hypothetical protein
MIRRLRGLPALALAASALAASSVAHASVASLNGQSVTVALQESGFPDVVDSSVIAGPGGPQIVGNTSDPIGSILFSAESVNLHDLQIVYHIEGSGGAYTGTASQCSGSPGCSLWSASPDDARFLFSGLSFGSPATVLDNVVLSPTNVFGAQVADITTNSFEVIFGSAGVLNGVGGNPALGTITLDLRTTVVPLPSSLVMMLGGLLLLSPFLRHRRIASSIRS